MTILTRLLLGVLLTLLAPGSQAVERVIRYHNDALGSPIFATNQRGEVVWRRSYTPYGEELNREAPNEPGYTGKFEEPDLGINDFGARWYDPRIGRFLAIDPVGFSPDNPQSFNRYAYANNNPYGFVDPDGRRSVIRGDRIEIQSEDKTVPALSLPNNVGAQGLSPSDGSFHRYNVMTPSSISAAQAGKGFRNNPTPGNDSPASPTGTQNDAGYIPVLPGSNMVNSYLIPSPDPTRFTDITVNYTISGEHKLAEGFVIRFGEIGNDGGITLRSYGEGNNWRQDPALQMGWGPLVEDEWQQNHREIINDSR